MSPARLKPGRVFLVVLSGVTCSLHPMSYRRSPDLDLDKPWASTEASLLLPVLPQEDLFDGLVASWTQSPFAAASAASAAFRGQFTLTDYRDGLV